MRKEIKLVPGVAYNMQVAATNGTEVSAWSSIISIPAQIKSDPPNPVASLSLGYYGSQFVASWDASIDPDFDYYKYYFLKGPGYSTPSIIKRTISPKIALTEIENRSLWGDGALNNDLKIVVSVVDKSGNESSLVTSSAATNSGPQPPGSAPLVEAGTDSILLEWTAPSGTGNTIDIVKYNIYVSTTTDSLGDFSLVDSTASLSYNYFTTYYGKRHYFYIKSVDKFGNESSTGSPIAQLNDGPGIPSVLSGIVSSIDSYSRSEGSPTAYINFNYPHGLSVGDQVYINDTVGDSRTVTAISVTGNIATVTTSTAHKFQAGDSVSISGSSNNSFNERVVVTSVTTSPPHQFTYYKPVVSGSYSGTAYAYAHTGLSTINTPFGAPATVTGVSDEDSFRCIPNGGTAAVDSVPNASFSIDFISSTGGFATYADSTSIVNLTNGSAVGLKFTAKRSNDASPTLSSTFFISDADIVNNTTSSITIRSSATGNYTGGLSGSINAPGYVYPSSNAVRIKSDGITIGNMSTGFIVGISPTSFNMQSSSSSTKLSITNDEIAMYKSGTQSVSFKSDGSFLLRSVTGGAGSQRIEIDSSGISLYNSSNSKTVSLDGSDGNATIVGKFSTGFSPNARVVLDSGDTVPESIQFYSGSDIETDHGSVLVGVKEDIGVRENGYVPFGLVTGATGSTVQVPSNALITSSSNNVTLPTPTINVDDTADYPASGAIDVETTLGWQTVLYTGKTATTFTGCTGGSGVINTGNRIGARVYLTFTSPHTYSTIPSSGPFWSPAVSYQGGELEYYNKDGGVSQKTVSNISALSSGSRTITTSATAHGYEVGDVVVIAGVNPATLNETVFVRSVPSFNTFTYQTSQSATYNSGGSSTHTASLRGVRVTDYGSMEPPADGMYNGDLLAGYPRYGEILIEAPKTATGGSASTASSTIELTSAKMFGTTSVENPTVEINGKLRFPYAGDVSLTGNTHALQIGSTESINLVIDNNEIMGRNNGGTGNLILNANGGNVSVNGSIVKGVVSGSGTTTAGGTQTVTHGLGGGVVPNVVCTVKAGAGSTNQYFIYVSSVNATQFSVTSLVNGSVGSVNYNWIAVAP